MAASRETAIKNLEKAVKSPRIGKHGKSQKTIEKEKWDAYYQQEMEKKWASIVNVHLDEATKAKNFNERKLAIEQVRGKATEKIDLGGEVTLKLDV